MEKFAMLSIVIKVIVKIILKLIVVKATRIIKHGC